MSETLSRPCAIDVVIVYIDFVQTERAMPKSVFLGEFEQLVLLVLLRLQPEAYALPAREELSRITGQGTSRGALYRTLERMGSKGYVEWELEDEVPRRGGHPRRRFTVTPEGVAALRASRAALQDLWSGLDEALG